MYLEFFEIKLNLIKPENYFFTWNFLERVNASVEDCKLLALLDSVRNVRKHVLAHIQL